MRGLAFLVKFSYRNLFRSPKRTVIMVLSLALGSGFIIWDLNFANSGSKEIMKEFLSQYAGQYHITHPAYYDLENNKTFNIYRTIDDSQVPPGLREASTRRVTAPVFISGSKKTLGVLLTGLEVEKERRLAKLHTSVKDGRHLDPRGRGEVIIGKTFARKIQARVGDQVAVIGQAVDGSVANELLTVVGLIDFGGGDLEDSLAFTQIGTATEFMAMEEGRYHQRVSFDPDPGDLPSVPGLKVTPWTDLLNEISVAVRFIDNFTWIVGFIIVIVISLGLSNTLMITFFEREQEFQSLNTIGAKTRWITLSLMIEVFLMGTLALALGMVLGHLLTTYCYYHPIDLKLFTGNKPLIMGGMSIHPFVRLYPVSQYYWQVPLLIYFFLSLTMVYPLVKVIKRSKHAV